MLLIRGRMTNALPLLFSLACGGTFMNTTGVISSPRFPMSYPRMADCIYKITELIGNFINITIKDIDLDCNEFASVSDYLELRDGMSKDSPLMAKLCGNGSMNPKFLQTTQNTLWIR